MDGIELEASEYGIWKSAGLVRTVRSLLEVALFCGGMGKNKFLEVISEHEGIVQHSHFDAVKGRVDV